MPDARDPQPREDPAAGRGDRDDDAYVIDTRRPSRRLARAARASSSSAGSTRRGPERATKADRPTREEQQSRGRVDDGAYVVDTRDQRRRTGPVDGRGGGSTAVAPTERRDPPRRRVRKGRLALLIAVVLLVAWIGFMIWVPVAAWNNVARVDNVPDGERPPATSGHNYLLVGSDSRDDLTREERNELTTGGGDSTRTDTIMLVHVPSSGGKPVIVSIPRDSYLPIPGYGRNKVNAAFALGGAKLLTETIEQATGVHLDGYLEIGLGGFAAMVEGLGGVRICVPRDMNDPKAGIQLKKGCQVLGGADALGYVRSRYEDPLGDIGRANRQRQFLGAVMQQAATPATVLIPWRYKAVADAVSGGLTVGEDTSLIDAFRVLQTMRAVSNDEGLSLGVPTANLAYPTSNAGLAVLWDEQRAEALFRALRNDEPLTEPPAGTTTE